MGMGERRVGGSGRRQRRVGNRRHVFRALRLQAAAAQAAQEAAAPDARDRGGASRRAARLRGATGAQLTSLFDIVVIIITGSSL